MKTRKFDLRKFSEGRTSSPFANGLRPTEEELYEADFLSLATNAYLMESGCFNAEKFTRTFNLDEDAQIFSAYKGIFVLTDDSLYSYDLAILTQLLTGLTVGGMWSMADFGDYLLFTNGEINLIRDPSTGIFATDDGTIFPLAKSICAHRGRLILGGPKNYPEAGEGFSNWVAWSDINNLAFLKSTDLDQARQNLSGYMPMPWEGNVLKVEPLNDKVIVYGDNGITALKLSSTDLAASTYGQDEIHDVGIKWQGSMTTNGKRDSKTIHYFVDSTGWLYELGNDLNPKKLGYKEFLG